MQKKGFYSLPAFTIIELAIVLMVMGIIAGAVFKGQDLLESARIRSVVNDFNRYKMAIALYQETYSVLPGDDRQASSRFGNPTTDGNGNGIIEDNESALVWQHLAKGGFIAQDQAPSSKLGGKYSIVHQPNGRLPGHWIQLGKENAQKNDGGLLTPRQAQMIKTKCDEGGNSDPFTGSLRIMDGKNTTAGQCINNNQLNLSVTAPTCIVLMQMD